MLVRHSALVLVPSVLLALAIAPAARAQSCAGDLNADGIVNGADLGQLLASWGPCVSCTADMNGDGEVGGADLGVQLGNWGECVTVPAWATLVEAQPDPAVVTDASLRAAILATGLAWRVRDTATQVELLLVPPGTFQMGCIMGSNGWPCYPWEQPVHQVTLTNAFYLGRYEVTQEQWTEKMGSNPSYYVSDNGYPGSGTRPVERVSWITIQPYLGATGFRLPTEAEWEYACRAGTQTPFSNGSTDDNSVGNLAWYYNNTCEGGAGCGTRPVGGKAANALGFHDMLGNVWEWVNDRYDLYTDEAQQNPAGPESGSNRVVRGGSWDRLWDWVRSSNRTYDPPSSENDSLGFRVARTP